MFKSYTMRDWVRFVEAYGHAMRLGKYGRNASDEERAVLTRAVRNIGVDAAAIIPEEMDITFVDDATVRGRSEIYRDLVQYIDNQLSIAILGQTLTTQSGDSGSGSYALGQVHNLVREDIERSDARQLAATLRRDLVVPIVALNHGPRARYPRLKIERVSEPNLDLLSQSLERLVPLGLRVRADQVRSLFRLEAPDADDEVLTAPGGGSTDPPSPPPAKARDAGGDHPSATGRAEGEEEDDPIPALRARTRDALGPLIDGWADRIREDLGGARTLADARARLDPGVLIPDAGAFAAALAPALIAADLAGRYDVLEEAGEIEEAREAVALASAAQHTQLPFTEQIEFFRGKTNLNTESWSDVWHDAHDRAFVVAGAAHDDLVADLRGAVDKAVADGTTLDTFRRDFDAVVAKHGWTYKGGRDWRTRVIYGTNLRTSYAAGQYQQMKAIAERRPYWRYRHSDASEHPRHQHVAWDGLVLKHDDPWWDVHYPPNGWGCKCYVEALNERGLRRLGKEGPDRAPAVRMRTVTVGAKGPTPRTVEVPEGIDPGWAYAPGQGQRSGGELLSPAEYTLAGREIRREIEAKVKAAPTSPQYETEWRRELRRRLRQERGAGTVPARVDPIPMGVKGDTIAAQRVRAAAEDLPAPLGRPREPGGDVRDVADRQGAVRDLLPPRRMGRQPAPQRHRLERQRAHSHRHIAQVRAPRVHPPHPAHDAGARRAVPSGARAAHHPAGTGRGIRSSPSQATRGMAARIGTSTPTSARSTRARVGRLDHWRS